MKNLAVHDMIEEVRKALPDATPEEIVVAMAMQYATDHRLLMTTTAEHLAKVIQKVRGFRGREPIDAKQ